MQIRRYTGPDLASVLERIRRELGPHVAIVNSRRVHQGGFFGILGRPAVEVTVAVDYDFAMPPAGVDAEEGPWPPNVLRAPAGPASRRPAAGGAPPRRGEPGDATPQPPRGPVLPRGAHDDAGAARRPRVAAFRPAVEDPLLAARRELNAMRVSPRGVPPGGEPSVGAAPLSDDLERVYRVLVRNAVEPDIARKVVSVFDEQLNLLGEDWPRAQPRFERYVGGLIRTTPGIRLREGKRPHVAMFIGPTGVGKTTTIAKIASQFSLIEHRKVAIVTADTYRMAATDQMRRYGDILGIPVHVVETPEDMEQALLRLGSHDLVLVDTAGRSPQHREHMRAMKELVEATRPDEVHLVISLTTKYMDVLQIVARFGIVPVNRVVLTKVDETRAYGLVLNLSMRFTMDVSYLTTGQQVPDDLEPADPARLARLVLSGYGAEQNGRSSS
jgi:flagellar biosynthesis protein FlhF